MAQETAQVTVTGTPENPVFNFVLPSGAKGEPGGWNFGTPLPVGTDLNTVTAPGLYQQTLSPLAAERALLNYPPTMNDSSGSMRGGIRVYPWGGSKSAIIQEYVNIGIRAESAFIPMTTWRRHNYPGAEGMQWSLWTVIAPDRSVTDANGLKTRQVWDENANSWFPVAGPGGLTAPTKLTHTTDLNTLFTPGVYALTSSAAPNLPVSLSGTLTINARYLQGEMYGPSITQHFVPFHGVPGREGQVEYRRTFTGEAWHPWRTHVAQRVDQTAGRVIYTWDDVNNREQMIYSDTGWRDISANLITDNFILNPSQPRCLIRREGSDVHLMMRLQASASLIASGQGKSLTLLPALDIPAGFTEGPISYALTMTGVFHAGGTIEALAAGPTHTNAQLRIAGTTDKPWTANGVLGFNLRWKTNAVWPTSLPGTAA